MNRIDFPKFSGALTARATGTALRRGRRSLPAVEGLEGRMLLSGSPTIYTVTSADGGFSGLPSERTGTLSYVVSLANADTNPAGSLIEFDSAAFPTDMGTEISITNPVELSETAGPEVITTGAANWYSSNVTIDGGGVTGLFIIESGVTATLSGLNMNNGSAPDGGAILNKGSLTIDNSGVGFSTAAQSGGDIDNTGPLLSINDSRIALGTAPNGGGIYNTGGLSIANSMVTSNTATTKGGGIDNFGGTVHLSQAYFVGNSANSGGGIANPTGTVTSVETTFVLNSASLFGGAIANAGTLTAVNNTIAFNSVNVGGTGGGVYGGPGSTTTLYNTIAALNTFGTSDGAAASDVGGSLSSASGYNMIGIGGSGGLVTGTNGNQVSVANSDLGFDRSSLGDHGGPAPSVALYADSPAIDAGSNVLAVDPATGSIPAADQRGSSFSRIVDGVVDIGSYEYTPIAADLHLVVTAPSSVDTSVAFGTTVMVETERDTVATSYTGSVTLALTSPGAATLGGTVTASVVDGVASFTGVNVNRGGTFTLTAVSAGVASATSSAITVNAPPQIIGEELLITGKGRHKKVVGFQLIFNEPLDSSSAGSAANYLLSQSVKRGRKTLQMPVKVRVLYTPASNAVDLIIGGKPTFTKGGLLQVKASAPGGVASAQGVALDGGNEGVAGNDGIFLILPKIHGIER